MWVNPIRNIKDAMSIIFKGYFHICVDCPITNSIKNPIITAIVEQMNDLMNFLSDSII